MQAKMKKSIRTFSVVSLLFLAQCCCCILPVGYQIQGQRSPAVQQFIRQVETFYQDVTASLEGFTLVK